MTRLIDGDKLLNWLKSMKSFITISDVEDAIKSDNFVSSNQGEAARLREALEKIAFGRVEGDYSDIRQYAREALEGGGTKE